MKKQIQKKKLRPTHTREIGMKKRIFTLLLFVELLSANMWADGTNGLWIVKKSGEKVGFTFTQEPSIAYSNMMLIITAGDVESEIPINEIEQIYFASDVTAINNRIDETHPVIDVVSDGVILSGFNARKEVDVYDVTGRVVKSSSLGKNDVLHLSLSNLSAGIYIVSVGSYSVKIKK